MNSSVYDKTDKGRDEIATRKNQLPPRLRTLLVMIDGRLPLDSLLKNFAGLGVTQESIDELISQDYIELVGGAAPGAPAAPARPAHPRPGVRRPPGPASVGDTSALDADTLADVGDTAMPAAAAAAAVAADLVPVAVPQNDAERFRHLYDFYNQTIKSIIGFRGIMLQLKVEKCANVEDFRALRLPYLEAVLKAKGSEMAHSMRGRLDHLLGGKPEREDFVLPDD